MGLKDTYLKVINALVFIVEITRIQCGGDKVLELVSLKL